MKSNRLATYLGSAVLVSAAFIAPVSGQAIQRTDEGVVHVDPVPMDASLKNQVTPEYEAEFWKRANRIIRVSTKNADGSWKKPYTNTFFENEKRSYPAGMFAILAGNEKAGLDVLQADDADAGDNKHTLGIDLFPAFTLKGQVRKYFYFGSMLTPAYRDKMKQAFDIWTKTDPRTTPHPIYQKFNPKVEGWGPTRFGNRQVDSRNTDNLRAMRDIAIYLFAEEAGNKETMEAAKKDIIFYVNTLYTVGQGEWDSDTYLPHVVTPYLCLYDFAKDPAMRSVAKAALDHFFTSAALKYRNATFAGPSKRDYGNGYRAMAQHAFSPFFSLYFGESERAGEATEPDLLHAITSNYRPPQAVIALASKQFTGPVEILGTKPVYENWKDDGRLKPGYFETLFFASTYQMGSLDSSSGDGDTGPFRLVAANSKHDTDVIVFNSRPKFNEKFPGDQMGQYRNLLVWLRPTDKANAFSFFLPKDARIDVQDGVWFVALEKTWLAIRPINLGALSPAKSGDAKAAEEFSKRYPDTVVQSAPSGDGAYAGFAMEIGEQPQTYDSFKADVLAKGKLDLADITRGKVRLTGSDGNYVELIHNATSDLPTLDRNGVKRDWTDPANFKLWQTVGSESLVSLGWKEGTLRVSVGGHTIESSMTPDGKATFKDK